MLTCQKIKAIEAKRLTTLDAETSKKLVDKILADKFEEGNVYRKRRACDGLKNMENQCCITISGVDFNNLYSFALSYYSCDYQSNNNFNCSNYYVCNTNFNYKMFK